MPYLQELKLHQFRNFNTAAWQFAPKLNIISGMNGAGKTSILEAIYFLAHGRSFRAKELNRMMQQNCSQFTIFAEALESEGNFSLAMQRSMNGDHKNRLDHSELKSASQVAERLPVLLFNPESFQLLMGGAKNRRQLLDWGVFYQYPEIRQHYLNVKKSLKQRNAALKQKLPRAQIKLWEHTMVESALCINQARNQYFTELLAVSQPLLNEFSEQHLLSFQYEQGWPLSETLSETWERSFVQDARAGLTHYGPHQADLKIIAQQKPARDILSRGQQKLLISLLKLAQGQLLQQVTKKAPIYLLDDLDSELDAAHQHLLNTHLAATPAQVLLTCIDPMKARAQHHAEIIQLSLN